MPPATPKYRAEVDEDAHPFAGGWRVVSDDGVLCENCSQSEAEMIARACNAPDVIEECAKLVEQYTAYTGAGYCDASSPEYRPGAVHEYGRAFSEAKHALAAMLRRFAATGHGGGGWG